MTSPTDVPPVSSRTPPPLGEPDRGAILLVDDHEANLLSLKAVLEGVGREIICARSGEEALRLVLERDFAAILLDVEMPGLDGFATAELVRSRDRTRDTPILFLTAHSQSDERVHRGYDIGAVDFVFKPVVPELLRAKVRVFVELDDRRRREADLRRELVRSNEDLSRFAFVAAHDLQAPLRAIVGGLRDLERSAGGRGDESSRSTATQALAQTTRLRELIRSLLDYARVRTQAPRIDVADTAALVDDALLALRAALEGARAVVTRDPLPRVRADPTLVRQLFQNLIDNAVKYRGNRPARVHLGCQRSDDHFEFSVRDEGPGVASSDRERLFEAFQRGGGGGGETVDGTGLGLAICREIVERHGGRIWHESTTPSGATFKFTLPAAMEPVAG